MHSALIATPSLTTVTSIAAVLALSPSPTMAGPAFDLSVSSTQSACSNPTPSPPGVSSCALTFYALPGQAATGQTVGMTAGATKITGTQTFSAAPTGFSGAAMSSNKNLDSGSTFTSNTYGFTGGSTAGLLGETTTSMGTGTASVVAGNGKNGNPAQSSSLAFAGITVAPIQSVGGATAGFVLVGTSGTASLTVTNKGHGNLANGGTPSSGTNLNGTVGTGDSVFAGGGGAVSLADGGSKTFTYTFTPTKQSSSQSSVAITTNFTNGNATGNNKADTASTTLTGQGVAPVQLVTAGAPVLARAGGPSTAATVTVTNTGNGNLATGGPSPTSNLNGTIDAITGSTNWTGGPTTFSIRDNTSGAPPGSNSSTFGYTYAPGTTRSGPNTGNIGVLFTNGNSNGSNTAQTVPVSLVGSTVGPVYQSQFPGGTVNTPGKNGGAPVSTIGFGTVAGKGTEALTLANISTDANGGNTTLTDLSIENFTISGTNKSNFSIGGKQGGSVPVTVLHEGDSEVVDIEFSGVTKGSYTALLTFQTDEGAAFGGLGNFYTYTLTAFSDVPEPASVLLLSVGLGGVLIVRKGRRRRGEGARLG